MPLSGEEGRHRDAIHRSWSRLRARQSGDFLYKPTGGFCRESRRCLDDKIDKPIADTPGNNLRGCAAFVFHLCSCAAPSHLDCGVGLRRPSPQPKSSFESSDLHSHLLWKTPRPGCLPYRIFDSINCRTSIWENPQSSRACSLFSPVAVGAMGIDGGVRLNFGAGAGCVTPCTSMNVRRAIL